MVWYLQRSLAELFHLTLQFFRTFSAGEIISLPIIYNPIVIYDKGQRLGLAEPLDLNTLYEILAKRHYSEDVLDAACFTALVENVETIDTFAELLTKSMHLFVIMDNTGFPGPSYICCPLGEIPGGFFFCIIFF